MEINHLPLTQTIAPADEAGVAAAVREAGRSGAVYPLGGMTRLDYGAHPSRPGTGLSLAKLDQVIDYPAHDMTITVQAGMTIAELARTLAARGQRLPVDMPHAQRATVGGAVAVAAAGPRRYGYGTLGDYVLGLRVVDGRGTVFAAGGRVVKNAAGYNLCRLLVGSLGTLGVVTQVTLMLRPLPETSALAACDVRDLAMAEQLLAGLIHTRTVPVAVELRSGPPHQAGPVSGPAPEGRWTRLFVGFEGSRAEVEWMVAELSQEWRRAGVSSLATVSGSDTEAWWNWLADFPADLQVSTLPRAMIEAMTRLRQLLPDCCQQAHAGNGLLRVQLSRLNDQPSGDSACGFAALLREKLRPAVAALGGKLVVLSSPGKGELSRDDIWGPPGDAAALMRAVKDRFDPAGVLNPGRFVY
jgi:glycolate oxidase FAD binding subunit